VKKANQLLRGLLVLRASLLAHLALKAREAAGAPGSAENAIRITSGLHGHSVQRGVQSE
jgi:hypothetical protein